MYVAPVMTVELIMVAAAKAETSENIPETQLEVRIGEMSYGAGAVIVERERQNSPIFLERAAVWVTVEAFTMEWRQGNSTSIKCVEAFVKSLCPESSPQGHWCS